MGSGSRFRMWGQESSIALVQLGLFRVVDVETSLNNQQNFQNGLKIIVPCCHLSCSVPH